MSRVRVAIVDDHTLFREGLKSLLATCPSVDVVAEGASGDEAMQIARDMSPEVMLVDLTMPESDGFSAIRRIAEAFPQVRVVVLTVHRSEAFVGRAIELGARGYVLKTATLEQLVEAIHAVGRGEYYLHPPIAHVVVGACLRGGGSPSSFAGASLTEREVEILKLIAQGHTSREIAGQLGISVKTVENHRSSLLNKIGARDRVDMVRFAIRTGLIQP